MDLALGDLSTEFLPIVTNLLTRGRWKTLYLTVHHTRKRVLVEASFNQKNLGCLQSSPSPL